jgi:hypothetical protein
MDPSCRLCLPVRVNLQEIAYIVEGCTYQVHHHELPSGTFDILHMPAVKSVQIHGWEVKSEPGGSVYVSHNRYINLPLSLFKINIYADSTKHNICVAFS